MIRLHSPCPQPALVWLKAPPMLRAKVVLHFAAQLWLSRSPFCGHPRYGRKIFRCSKCNRRFETIRKLSRHLVRHSKHCQKGARRCRTVEEIVLERVREISSLIVLRRYRLVGTLRPIAECFSGYWSDVWSGEWGFPGKQPIKVAIKYLRAAGIHSDDGTIDHIKAQLLQRLYKEVLSWRDLEHPHILPLLGFLSGPKPCLISPWCSQGSISKYLKQNPKASRTGLLIQISDGLEYLHGKGIVHGDIKSANILINDQHQALLCDFGVAIMLQGAHTGLTTSEGTRGTIPYMAPELLNDERHTPSSDVYAFGHLSLEVLTGKRPYFNYINDGAIVTAIVCGRTPRRSDYSEVQDHTVWALLEQCWVMKPEDRPSIGVVRQGLKHITPSMTLPSQLSSSENPAIFPRRRLSSASTSSAPPDSPLPEPSKPWVDSSNELTDPMAAAGPSNALVVARKPNAPIDSTPTTQEVDSYVAFSYEMSFGEAYAGTGITSSEGPHRPRRIRADAKARPPIVRVYQEYVRGPVSTGLRFVAGHERISRDVNLPEPDFVHKTVQNEKKSMLAAPITVKHSIHDYEGLPGYFSPALHLAAGSLSGTFETALVHPLDTLKTRTQSLANFSSSVDGKRLLWRGLSAAIAGAGPAKALQFGVYDIICNKLEQGNDSMRSASTVLTAGIGSTMSSAAFLNPLDVVKQRMQIISSLLPLQTMGLPAPTILRTVKNTYAHEGLRAFYTSYPTTLLTTLPLTTIQFAAYEYFSRFFNPLNEYSPRSHIIAGGLAGGLAGAVTTPLDIVKTVLQTKGVSNDAGARTVNGLSSALVLIWRRAGLRGLSKGMGLRAMTLMPSHAVSWLTYEYFKRMIG